jgi:hypothetical protein
MDFAARPLSVLHYYYKRIILRRLLASNLTWIHRCITSTSIIEYHQWRKKQSDGMLYACISKRASLSSPGCVDYLKKKTSTTTRRRGSGARQRPRPWPRLTWRLSNDHNIAPSSARGLSGFLHYRLGGLNIRYSTVSTSARLLCCTRRLDRLSCTAYLR